MKEDSIKYHEISVLIHFGEETFCDRFIAIVVSSCQKELAVVISLMSDGKR